MLGLVLAMSVGIGLPTAGVTPASAGRKEAPPAELEDVGITEHLEAQLPLQTPFTTSDGRATTLGDVLSSGRPVILTLNYSDCPMLCTLQLDALVDAMRDIPDSMGETFDVVTISIDPKEKPERAQRTKEKYLQRYGRDGAGEGWHFLVGEQASIDAVAGTVGFGYRFLPEEKQFAHAAALILLSPKGAVMRYLYGVLHDPKTLRLSLVEASEGKAGTLADRVLLYCFQYDPTKGQYAPFARNLMRAGGAVTVAALGGVLAIFWIRDSRKRRSSSQRDV